MANLLSSTPCSKLNSTFFNSSNFICD
jgi:hypothetical protein